MGKPQLLYHVHEADKIDFSQYIKMKTNREYSTEWLAIVWKILPEMTIIELVHNQIIF